MTTAALSTSRAPEHAGSRTFVQRHAVAIFIILAFVMTWAIQIPVVLDARGMLPVQLPGFLVLFMGPMPGIAALIVAALASGRAGVHDLVRRVVRWRVRWYWYVFAILGSGAIYLAGVYGSTLLGAPAPILPKLSATLLLGILVQFGIYLVFNWEDLGWRGFAATRLQAGHTALVTALILGVVEGAFHIPLFFAPGSSQASSPFWSFMLLSIGGVIVLNWVFNSTRGSVLLAMLFHAAANTWTDIVPIPNNDGLAWTMWAVVMGALGVVLLVVYGTRYLARKPDISAITVTDPLGSPAVQPRAPEWSGA